MPQICLISKPWRSGTGWYAQSLAAAIAEAGATLTFISPKAEPEHREPTHSNVHRVVIPREITEAAPRLQRIVASLRRSLTSLAKTLEQRRLTRVFIFSIPEPLVFTLPLFLLLRFSGARVILVVHDAQPHAWKFSGGLRAIERQAHALSYKLAHHLVVLAPAACDALQRLFNVRTSKISIIPHGPFSVGPIPPVPGTGRFLAFGTVRRNKNVLEAIRGIKLARSRGHDVRLLIAGEPHPHELDYWDDCIAETKGDPEGFEIDRRFVPDKELPEILSRVDAFILAYDNFDSQSGVAVLASVSGRPVIGSASGGLAELFKAGMSGVQITSDISADAIAAAVQSFRTVSVEEWRIRAVSGAEAVSATIAWSRIGGMFVHLAENFSRNASGSVTRPF